MGRGRKLTKKAETGGIGQLPAVNMYEYGCGAGHGWKTVGSLFDIHHLIMEKKKTCQT